MEEVVEGNRLGGADRQPSDTGTRGGLAATYRDLRWGVIRRHLNFPSFDFALSPVLSSALCLSRASFLLKCR